MGTSHHWNLKGGKGRQAQGCPQVSVLRRPPPPIPLPAPHGSSPDGHEVEDVRHPWAVAQEAADADLEHDGDHQDPVPVEEGGSDGLGTETNPPCGVGGQEQLREVKCARPMTPEWLTLGAGAGPLTPALG